MLNIRLISQHISLIEHQTSLLDRILANPSLCFDFVHQNTHTHVTKFSTCCTKPTKLPLSRLFSVSCPALAYPCIRFTLMAPGQKVISPTPPTPTPSPLHPSHKTFISPSYFPPAKTLWKGCIWSRFTQAAPATRGISIPPPPNIQTI